MCRKTMIKIMKLSLPYSTKEFNQLLKVKDFEVGRFKAIQEYDHYGRKIQLEKVLHIVDKLYDYINIDFYNKRAKNKCKFSNSDDMEGVCEVKFKNTLANYSSNGNCCKSCNSVILNRMKYVQD